MISDSNMQDLQPWMQLQQQQFDSQNAIMLTEKRKKKAPSKLIFIFIFSLAEMTK